MNDRAEIEDSDHTRVRVYPSSGVMVGEVVGPFVWLDVEPRAGSSAAAHMTCDEARIIRDALTAFLRESGDVAAPPKRRASAKDSGGAKSPRRQRPTT